MSETLAGLHAIPGWYPSGFFVYLLLNLNYLPMKRRVGCLLSVLLLLGLLPAAAKKPASAENSVEKLVRIDAEIVRRSLELNYLIWDCYLRYAERGRITPAVTNFPGMDFRSVCDTVPEIAFLQQEYLEADSLYKTVLRTDPEYEALHAEYAYVRNLPTSDPRQQENKKGYDMMYRRLQETNPAYVPAWESRKEAIRLRNMAITQFLLGYYKDQGREMPVEPVLAHYSKELAALRREWPEIERRETELNVLRKLRGELYEQCLREEFGVSKADAAPGLRTEINFDH